MATSRSTAKYIWVPRHPETGSEDTLTSSAGAETNPDSLASVETSPTLEVMELESEDEDSEPEGSDPQEAVLEFYDRIFDD